MIRLHQLLSRLLRTRRQRLLVTREVVEQAIRNDGEVIWEVQRRGDYEERKEEEKDRVCRQMVSMSPDRVSA